MLRIANFDETAWTQFEKWILEFDYRGFREKHKSMLIHAFAKANCGSQRLWELFEHDLLHQRYLSTKLDLKFVVWSFALRQRGSLELWSYLATTMALAFPSLSLYDIEFLLWSVEHGVSRFGAQDSEKIWR